MAAASTTLALQSTVLQSQRFCALRRSRSAHPDRRQGAAGRGRARQGAATCADRCLESYVVVGGQRLHVDGVPAAWLFRHGDRDVEVVARCLRQQNRSEQLVQNTHVRNGLRSNQNNTTLQQHGILGVTRRHRVDDRAGMANDQGIDLFLFPVITPGLNLTF